MLLHYLNPKSKKEQNILLIDISLQGYQAPICTPTEATKGRVLLYVSNELDFRLRPDLNLSQAKGVESIFFEIVNKNKCNDFVGVIYRRPSMFL